MDDRLIMFEGIPMTRSQITKIAGIVERMVKEADGKHCRKCKYRVAEEGLDFIWKEVESKKKIVMSLPKGKNMAIVYNMDFGEDASDSKTTFSLS